VTFQDTQTDCVQDTAQRMKLKRLKASTALMTRQTDAEQRRPTIKKLEVKQVEFKLGEDCWDIQDKSIATLAKAYSQVYNRKCRHLGVRHSMIHELITNEVVSIEFVMSQQNLADHLTNGLARDLVIKSAEGMELKPN
ncbi:hypothetical protein Tco_1148223, partial [Tanacetum coccineum]